MNFLHFTYKVKRRLIYWAQLFWFYIKKPFYILSFNQNGNKFQCDGVLLNTSVNISGNNNCIIIQGGVKISNMRIVVTGMNNRMIIRKNSIFREGGRVKLEDENNLIDIGENTDIVDWFCGVSDYDSKIIVGKDCMFSAKVIIRNSDVHSILNEEGKRINPARDTIIGERVWIGYGANILKGCHIGDDSVIGTQSVVAGLNTSKGCVIAGNPAKVVKQGVHWDRIRIR